MFVSETLHVTRHSWPRYVYIMVSWSGDN